ncbi:MAG: hypothetical protein AVDCRST_MAG71-2801 [uncultured Lysobacter sp.]|uniref:Uncharacterized protein n=1 Tax=uncultured Lysobacter sp. TaxID=271060 RepID=A0A6J4MC76_9GAMM|nr:MAG: hypothetical protein AVDCRST_MAG71-2801 [uncultured Lysobacter sp.]
MAYKSKTLGGAREGDREAGSRRLGILRHGSTSLAARGSYRR